MSQLLGLRDRHGLVRGPAGIGLRETDLHSRGGPGTDLHDALDPSPGVDGQVGCPCQRLFIRLCKTLRMIHEHAKWLGLEGEAERSIGPGDSLRVGPLVELAVVELARRDFVERMTVAPARGRPSSPCTIPDGPAPGSSLASNVTSPASISNGSEVAGRYPSASIRTATAATRGWEILDLVMAPRRTQTSSSLRSQSTLRSCPSRLPNR